MKSGWNLSKQNINLLESSSRFGWGPQRNVRIFFSLKKIKFFFFSHIIHSNHSFSSLHRPSPSSPRFLPLPFIPQKNSSSLPRDLTRYSKTKHKLPHQDWARQSSSRKRVSKMGKRVRDTPHLSLPGVCLKH